MGVILERSTEGSIGTDRLTDGRIEGGAEGRTSGGSMRMIRNDSRGQGERSRRTDGHAGVARTDGGEAREGCDRGSGGRRKEVEGVSEVTKQNKSRGERGAWVR